MHRYQNKNTSETNKNMESVQEIMRMMEQYAMPERKKAHQSALPGYSNDNDIDFSFRDMMINKSVLFNIINPEEYFALTKKKSR